MKTQRTLTDPLTGAEMTGLTFASASLSVLQVVINVFITYYYTNVVGLGVAAVGTLLLVTRIADGFSDLGMGVVISKTRSRFGQARPWAIRMAVPLLMSVILTFFVPPVWNQTAKTIYACVTYFLMITVAITPAGIAGTVLSTNMTVNAQSRQKSSICSTIFVMIGSVGGNLAVLRITESLGDTYETWRLIAVAFGLLASAGQAAMFFLTKERVGAPAGNELQPKAKKGASIRASLPALIHNKYFIIMCVVGMFGALDGAMAGCGVYYVKYVLCDMNLIGIIGIITLLPTLAGVALTPLIAKKISAKYIILAGQLIKVITFLINLLLPTNTVLFIAFAALRAFVGAPLMIYAGVYLLGTIEYGERKTGIRANSLIISVSSVGSKVGSGIGGALIGWLLSFGGYVGTAAVQPAAARDMIVYVYFLIPLIAAAAQFILLYFYRLDRDVEQPSVPAAA